MFNKNFNPITGNRFFAGDSDQEKAAKDLYRQADYLPSSITNRFENYRNPFDYNSMLGNLEKTYSGYEDIINRDTAEQIARQQSGAASSMASRGITGGSILSDTQSKIASDINRSKTNALANLGIGKSSAINELMRYFNQLGLLTTQGASNIDRFNLGAQFQKYGAKGGAAGMLGDDTWFDDLFAGMNAAGNLAKGIL